MLSPFGKFCRKLRLERGELLLDMAKKLQVQSSYLSSVEVGRKSVPESWKDEIANLETTQVYSCYKLILRFHEAIWFKSRQGFLKYSSET